jgi:hypothetical protein
MPDFYLLDDASELFGGIADGGSEITACGNLS